MISGHGTCIRTPPPRSRRPLLRIQPSETSVRRPSWSSSCTARGVRPSPQTFSRGKEDFSSTRTRRPASARCRASVEPAGPAPTTSTSASCVSMVPPLVKVFTKSSRVRQPRAHGPVHRDDTEGEVAPRDALPPGLADAQGQLGLVRPRVDRVDEVAVGLPVRAHQPRHPRQPVVQVRRVRLAQQRVRDRRELADDQPPTRPHDARHLPQPRVRVDDVAQAERDRRRVEDPVANGSRVASPTTKPRSGRRRLPAWTMPAEKSHGTTRTPRSAKGSLERPVPAARSRTVSPAGRRRPAGRPGATAGPDRRTGRRSCGRTSRRRRRTCPRPAPVAC